MKERTLTAIRPIHIGGSYVEVGTVLAVVVGDYPLDSIYTALVQGLVQETVEGESDAKPVPPQLPSDIPMDDPVDADGESVQVPEDAAVDLDSPAEVPVVDVDPTEGTTLRNAGLAEGVAVRLEKNGIHTVEELRQHVADGNDLVELDEIGTTYAKRILGWLENQK